MTLCKNSKCPLKLSCSRYQRLLDLAGTGKLKEHVIEIFELDKGKCENYLKIKL